jgi:hypothetical protein
VASFRIGRACLLVAALALPLLAACSDDEGGGSATPTAAAPGVTPEDPAIIDGQVFISVASGYAVEYPEGWSPDDNFLFTPQTVSDVFFAPVEGDGEGAQGNIQVRCDRADGSLTAEDFIEARAAVASGFALGDVQRTPITIADVQGERIEYQQAPTPDITVAKTDLVFFGHGCGWTVTLTQGLDQDYRPQFDAMVATFRFAN